MCISKTLPTSSNCGGPRITHELAKELGYDAGFGAGKYADDVASFAVTEMVKRGMK